MRAVDLALDGANLHAQFSGAGLKQLDLEVQVLALPAQFLSRRERRVVGVFRATVGRDGEPGQSANQISAHTGIDKATAQNAPLKKFICGRLLRGSL